MEMDSLSPRPPTHPYIRSFYIDRAGPLHILTLPTHFAIPAQNERCLYGQTNMHERTNEPMKIFTGRIWAVCSFSSTRSRSTY